MFNGGFAAVGFSILASPAAATSLPERNAAVGKVEAQQAPAFIYENGFWRNLHHSLYAFASADPNAGRVRRIRLSPADLELRAKLSPDEAAIWNEAVAWYAANLLSRNLLFDDGLVGIGDALSAAKDAPTLNSKDIPTELRAILLRAAPIYPKRWWPAHSQANESWRVEVESHLAAHGARVASRMSLAYGVPWPKAVPVVLTAYANSAGAYTVLHPTRVAIATTDAGNSGQSGFEILMHETAHAMIRPVRERLQAITAAEIARPGADAGAVRRDLWHEILFDVTGRIVADAIPGYVPYADRNELWRLAWPGRDRELLARYLDPYIEGAVPLDTALTDLVRALTAASPAEHSAHPAR